MSAYDNRKCYGFVKSKDSAFIIDEQESAVVTMIFDCFLNGQSLGQIADMLENKSILSPSGKATWSRKVLSSILSNEKYHIHGLLTKHTFDMAQIEKDRRNGKGDTNICERSVDAEENIVSVQAETEIVAEIDVVTTESIIEVSTETNTRYASPQRHHCAKAAGGTTSSAHEPTNIILLGVPPGIYRQVLMEQAA